MLIESIVPASKALYMATTWAPGARMSSATLSSRAWVSFSWTGASGILSTTVARPAAAAPSIWSGKSAATTIFSSPAEFFRRFQSVGPSSNSKSASASTACESLAAASNTVRNWSVKRWTFTLPEAEKAGKNAALCGFCALCMAIVRILPDRGNAKDL